MTRLHSNCLIALQLYNIVDLPDFTLTVDGLHCNFKHHPLRLMCKGTFDSLHGKELSSSDLFCINL